MEIFDEAYVVLRRPGKEPLALLDRCVSRNCLSAWHSQLNRRRCSPTKGQVTILMRPGKMAGGS